MKLKSKKMTLAQKSAWTGRLFVLPLYIGLIFFVVTPFVQSLLFSFADVKMDSSGYATNFIGLENFRVIFKADPNFTRLLVESITNLLWQVPVIIIASLFIAVILKSKFVGRTFVRSVFFLPVILASGFLLSIVNFDEAARNVMEGNLVSSGAVVETSALNDFLVNLGLGSKIVTLFSRIYNNIFTVLWKSGIQIVIFLAALQSISPTLYEASAVEGATAWEDFWKITIPMIKPMILINIFFTVIESFVDSNNQIMVKIMTSLQGLRLGLASSMAWTYFLIVAVILAIVSIIFSRFDDKNEGRRAHGLR